ncbi:MAG TPA: lytic transglycosylase domain-containing protein [Solirubrobacteraceae bacterium]|nr:lytic transglycosylase domain-containing protein [Solirubrobacteraceae bacterium]
MSSAATRRAAPAARNRQRAPARRPPTPRHLPRPRRGRRRLALAVFLLVCVVFGVRAAGPLFQKALRDLTLPLAYPTIIEHEAAAKHLDPALIAAVIDAETGFDARTSSAGAVGLMQVEPETAALLAHQSGATNFRESDLWTPAVNIAYGSYYLRELLNVFHGDKVAALAAYNGGATNVERWIARARQAGHAFGLSDIAFPATQAYVAKVLSAEIAYRQKYPAQLGLD